MIEVQAMKSVAVTPPAAIVDDGSFVSNAVDCKGFGHCRFLVQLGASDIAMAALKVQESDDDGDADAYADVPGAIFGTSLNTGGSASTLPSATDDNKLYAIDIDLRGRKRYQKLVATAGNGSTGTFLSAVALLSQAQEIPATAAARGLGQHLIV